MNFESFSAGQDTENNSEKPPENEQGSELNEELINQYVKEFRGYAKSLTNILPDNVFRNLDAGGWEDKADKLKDIIRDGIGESRGWNMDSDFMQNPINADDETTQEFWYDVVGSIDYIQGQVKNELLSIEEEGRERLEEIAGEMEITTRKLLTQVDSADPNALAYGMRSASKETKEFFWEQIRDKYSDGIRSDMLEDLVRRESDENIQKQAWDILSNRPDLEDIQLLRIVKNGFNSTKPEMRQIRSEAAEMLLSRLEKLESAVEEGREVVQQKLESFTGANESYTEFKEKLANLVE